MSKEILELDIIKENFPGVNKITNNYIIGEKIKFLDIEIEGSKLDGYIFFSSYLYEDEVTLYNLILKIEGKLYLISISENYVHETDIKYFEEYFYIDEINKISNETIEFVNKDWRNNENTLYLEDKFKKEWIEKIFGSKYLRMKKLFGEKIEK